MDDDVIASSILVCPYKDWSSFRTLSDTALSLLFVFLTYTGPGMFKSFVTLRTSNAWIHAIGYHAVAPNTLLDAPMIAKIFGLR